MSQKSGWWEWTCESTKGACEKRGQGRCEVRVGWEKCGERRGEGREFREGEAMTTLEDQSGQGEKAMCTRCWHSFTCHALYWRHPNTVQIVTVTQYSLSDRIVDIERRDLLGVLFKRFGFECVLRIWDLPKPQTRTIGLVQVNTWTHPKLVFGPVRFRFGLWFRTEPSRHYLGRHLQPFSEWAATPTLIVVGWGFGNPHWQICWDLP